VTRPVVAGHEWEWVPDTDPAWSLLPAGAARHCFRRDGQGRRCDGDAVASHRRAGGLYHFCGAHLYTREIHDGVLMVRRQRPIGVPA
jgi:hypothetical protein